LPGQISKHFIVGLAGFLDEKAINFVSLLWSWTMNWQEKAYKAPKTAKKNTRAAPCHAKGGNAK
jgi:hypothetical protein